MFQKSTSPRTADVMTTGQCSKSNLYSLYIHVILMFNLLDTYICYLSDSMLQLRCNIVLILLYCILIHSWLCIHNYVLPTSRFLNLTDHWLKKGHFLSFFHLMGGKVRCRIGSVYSRLTTWRHLPVRGRSRGVDWQASLLGWGPAVWFELIKELQLNFDISSLQYIDRLSRVLIEVIRIRKYITRSTYIPSIRLLSLSF